MLTTENRTKESPPKKSNKNLLYRLVAVVIVIVIIGVFFYYDTMLPSSGSGTPLTLYVGEISAQTYGFGNSSSSLTSNPGPSLTLKTGQTYTMTVHNVGTMQHNWATVDAKSSTANVVWGAVISNVINPGSGGKVTFKAGQVGNYFYICQVSGHVALGLWGTITVVQ